MDTLVNSLNEKLEVKTVFELPVFGGVRITESVVVMWIIMGVLLLFCFLMTRNLKVNRISKRQAFIEWVVVKLEGMIDGMLGHKAKGYRWYLFTVMVFIGFANIIGIFGFKSPTKDVNVTIALAVMSILLVEIAGLYHLGVKKWMHKFIEPSPVVLPINIMELVTKPLSLCMRLFGNVIGAFVIMALIELVVPVILPPVLSLYFDFFDGLLQAYVFVFLTSLYISEEVE